MVERMLCKHEVIGSNPFTSNTFVGPSERSTGPYAARMGLYGGPRRGIARRGHESGPLRG